MKICAGVTAAVPKNKKMTLSGYISGIVGLIKDFVRFGFGLLKRPHYVAVLIALIVGVFYFCGVSPREIPQVVQQKWQAFIANRKQVFSEELQSISERIDDKDNPLKQTVNKLSGQLDADRPAAAVQEKNNPLFINPGVSEQERRLFEEKFGWQDALETSDAGLPDLSGKEVVKGVVSVIGADKVRIAGRNFSLKVKLRPGRAGEAFSQAKRRFDGLEAKCLPDPADPDLADCFVGALGISEMLIDFGYADPL